MDCPKCKTQLLTESLGNGNTKVKCPKCGLMEIKDSKGRTQLLG